MIHPITYRSFSIYIHTIVPVVTSQPPFDLQPRLLNELVALPAFFDPLPVSL